MSFPHEPNPGTTSGTEGEAEGNKKNCFGSARIWFAIGIILAAVAAVFIALYAVQVSQPVTPPVPTALGFDPAPMYPDKSQMTLENWRSLIPEPHDQINGKIPPGIPIATNTSLLDLKRVGDTCFVTWWIPGRLVGYRTPIHVHPRPQEVCVASGAVKTMIEGREDVLANAFSCLK